MRVYHERTALVKLMNEIENAVMSATVVQISYEDEGGNPGFDGNINATGDVRRADFRIAGWAPTVVYAHPSKQAGSLAANMSSKTQILHEILTVTPHHQALLILCFIRCATVRLD